MKLPARLSRIIRSFFRFGMNKCFPSVQSKNKNLDRSGTFRYTISIIICQAREEFFKKKGLTYILWVFTTAVGCLMLVLSFLIVRKKELVFEIIRFGSAMLLEFTGIATLVSGFRLLADLRDQREREKDSTEKRITGNDTASGLPASGQEDLS